MAHSDNNYNLEGNFKASSLKSNFTLRDSTSRFTPQLHSTKTFMATNNAEGRREDAFIKQRAQNREEYERQKQTLINETEKARPSANKFVGQNDSMEETLKNQTIGLVRLEDFQQRRKELEEAKAREAARTNELKYVIFSVQCDSLLCRRNCVERWLIFRGGFV